ncbi:MAG: DUF5675 family protein [Paludibacter sp.]
MKLQLKRIYFAPDYTIGKLSIDGVPFCDVLEDTNRDKNHDGDLTDPGESKVFGETCIPFGTYKVIITPSVRFKRDLPLLVDVPGFEGIRIHPGNTAVDTHGCLLVGVNDTKGRVSQSKATFDKLFPILEAATEIEIEIV